MYYAIDLSESGTTDTDQYGYDCHGVLHVFEDKEHRDAWVRKENRRGQAAPVGRVAVSSRAKRVRHYRREQGAYRHGEGTYVLHAVSGGTSYIEKGRTRTFC